MEDARRIFTAVQFIEARLTDEISLQDGAAGASCSMYHVHRLFQTLTG